MKIVTHPRKCKLVFDLYFGDDLFIVELDQDILANTSTVSIKDKDGMEFNDDVLVPAIYEYIMSRYQLVYEPEISEYEPDPSRKNLFPDWDNDENPLAHFDPAL